MNSLAPGRPINFLKYGWEALHKTVLANGAERRLTSFGPEGLGAEASVDCIPYDLRLAPILDSLGIWLAPEYANEDILRRKVWNALKEALQAHDPKLWGVLTRPQSLTGLMATFTAWRHEETPRMRAGLEKMAPFQVATYAWKLIESVDKGKMRLKQVGWGLALLGWVAVIYDRLHPCELCFRWASPPGRFCSEHTQGRIGPGHGSGRYLRYRTARLVSAFDQNVGNIAGIGLRPFSFEQLQRQMLGRVLFCEPFSNDDASLVHQALLANSNVLRITGGSRILELPPPALMAHLQKRLDPLEVSAQGFFLKIGLAERWFEIAGMVAPGKRGPGIQTQRNVEKAIALARQGVICSKIATALKVQKSTVSNWKRRYPEFAEALK